MSCVRAYKAAHRAAGLLHFGGRAYIAPTLPAPACFSSAAAAPAASAEGGRSAVAIPAKGPLPAEARAAGAWKRNPAVRTEALMERSVADMAENVLTLLNAPVHHALPSTAFNRLLRRVETPEEWEVAARVHSACVKGGVQFTEESASLFVSAAAKTGNLPAALAALRTPSRSRLFPNNSIMRFLYKAAAKSKDAATLTGVEAIAAASGILKRKQNYALLATVAEAHAACGNMDGALRIVKRLATEKKAADGALHASTNVHPLAFVLATATEEVSKLSATQLEAIKTLVVPLAKTNVKLADAVTQFETAAATAAPSDR